MRAAEIMSKNVISVRPEESVLHAVHLMLQHRISGLPVIDIGGSLVGIVTEGDFLRRAETGTMARRSWWQTFLEGPESLAQEYARCHGRKVKDVMTRDVVTIAEDMPLHNIVALLEQHQIKRVPVMRKASVVGVVSRANLLRALVSVSRHQKPNDAADWAIRDQILAALNREPWAPSGSVDVTVQRGVVDLWGTILDKTQRDATLVLVENVPGVKAVNDHLRWFGPMAGKIIESTGQARV